MKKLVILIVILFLAVIGLGGYIAYDKIYLQKSSKGVVTQLGEKDIDLNVFSGINETLNKFDHAFNDNNTSYFGYLYNQKEVKMKKFDPKVALYICIHNYIINTGQPQNINEGVIKSEFQKIFDKNATYKPSDIDAGEKLKITYNKDLSTYSSIYSGTKDIYYSTYVEKNVSTTIEDENIVVKRKVFYVEYEPNETSITAKIYQNSDKKKLIASIPLKDKVLDTDEVIGKYGYKLQTYNYIFEEKTYKEYYIKEIVRV